MNENPLERLKNIEFDPSLYEKTGISPLTKEENDELLLKSQHVDFDSSQTENDMLDAFIQDLIKWGLDAVANWVKAWINSTTILHSRGAAYSYAGNRLHILLGSVDDHVDVWFNNEYLGSSDINDPDIWLISDSKIKKGKNVLVMALDNRGAWNYGFGIRVCRSSDNKEITSFVIDGNDYTHTNKHVIRTTIYGK